MHRRLRIRLVRPHAEHAREDDRTQRACDLGVDRLERRNALGCGADPAEQRVVQLRPVRLRVREERVEACDQGRDPEVERRPAVGQHLGRRRHAEAVRREEVERVRQEEAAVGGYLRQGVSAGLRGRTGRNVDTYEGGHEERPRRGGDGGHRVQ